MSMAVSPAHACGGAQIVRTHRRGYAQVASAYGRTGSVSPSGECNSWQGAPESGSNWQTSPRATRTRNAALCKAIKAQRKHLERQLMCPTPEYEAAEKTLAQLLAELRRIETAQPAALSSVPAAARPVATPAALLTVQLSRTTSIPATVQLDTMTVEALPAPRDYPVTGRVMVCQGSACRGKGALEVLQAVAYLAGDSETVEVLPCKCLGKCKQGAAIRVRPDGGQATTYTRVAPGQVAELLDSHFLPAIPAEGLVLP